MKKVFKVEDGNTNIRFINFDAEKWRKTSSWMVVAFILTILTLVAFSVYQDGGFDQLRANMADRGVSSLTKETIYNWLQSGGASAVWCVFGLFIFWLGVYLRVTGSGFNDGSGLVIALSALPIVVALVLYPT